MAKRAGQSYIHIVPREGDEHDIRNGAECWCEPSVASFARNTIVRHTNSVIVILDEGTHGGKAHGFSEEGPV